MGKGDDLERAFRSLVSLKSLDIGFRLYKKENFWAFFIYENSEKNIIDDLKQILKTLSMESLNLEIFVS